MGRRSRVALVWLGVLGALATGSADGAEIRTQVVVVAGGAETSAGAGVDGSAAGAGGGAAVGTGVEAGASAVAVAPERLRTAYVVSHTGQWIWSWPG